MGMPVTGRLFEGFEDKGWLFSKVLSVAAAGFFTWLLVSVRLLKFTTGTCILVTAACGIGCFWLFRQQTKKRNRMFSCGTGDIGLLGRGTVFRYVSSMDISCRFSPGGVRNRKIHGLWIYGGHDAQPGASGKGYLVFTGTY